MNDKNLNIMSPRTSDPLLYIIYNWHSNPKISETFIVSTSNHEASLSSFKQHNVISP